MAPSFPRQLFLGARRRRRYAFRRIPRSRRSTRHPSSRIAPSVYAGHDRSAAISGSAGRPSRTRFAGPVLRQPQSSSEDPALHPSICSPWRHALEATGWTIGDWFIAVQSAACPVAVNASPATYQRPVTLGAAEPRRQPAVPPDGSRTSTAPGRSRPPPTRRRRPAARTKRALQQTPPAQAGFVTVDVHLPESALHQIADELRVFGAGGADAGVVHRTHADGRTATTNGAIHAASDSLIDFSVVFSRGNCQ